ncbi:MAG: ABC transporter permease [bacterium]
MIRFLIKGLMRDRSRSLFPVLMVSAGAFLTVFLYSFMKGTMDDLINSNAKFDTGHVKIMTRAYEEVADQIPNDLALFGVNSLLEKLRSSERNMVWTPRIRFAGLLDIPDERGETRAQGPVMGLAVDLFSPESRERDILNLESAVVRGRMPQRGNEILISEEFAKKLGVEIGEVATLIGSTMNGAMAMHNFKVSGTVRFGITAMDRGAIIADVKDVQSALDMEDGASEIVGYSENMLYDDDNMLALTQRFNDQFSRDDDEFSPLMLSLSQHSGLREYLDLVDVFGGIIVLIFVVVMSIVLWNSGLINGLRRYGEIGVRLAMGEPKGSLYRWMIYESIIIGFIGSILGTVFGLAISYYLQYTGIDFAAIMQKSTMLISNVMRARVTGWSYVIGFVPGLVASVVGTMFAGIGIYRRQTSQLFKELEV